MKQFVDEYGPLVAIGMLGLIMIGAFAVIFAKLTF